MRFYKLRCAVKNYEWGKPALESAVAQLVKADDVNFIVEDKPYAELWMGTHPSGLSVIPSENVSLLEMISKNPHCLGSNIRQKFGNNLPFLFKVLSVNKALSIQVHPNKFKAEELRKDFPELYPDDNHKPEIAIALTKFEALCGFRPISEIKEFLRNVPPLSAVVGEECTKLLLNVDSSEESSKAALKKCFSVLMSRPEESYKQHLKDLVNLLSTSCDQPCNIISPIRDLFLCIHSDYPGDVGCFCLFFLNYITLQPGQAIFLAANVPHAYLKGDCIECMACSDNVVRAGLTPKRKDVATLCDILSYQCKSAEENIFPAVKDSKDPYLTIYDPPVNEFAVMKIDIPNGNVLYNLKALESASIVLVVEGSAIVNNTSEEGAPIALRAGSIFFIGSDVSLSLQTSSKFLMFRAYCSL